MKITNQSNAQVTYTLFAKYIYRNKIARNIHYLKYKIVIAKEKQLASKIEDSKTLNGRITRKSIFGQSLKE